MPETKHNRRHSRRDEAVPWVPALLIVIAIIVGLYFWLYPEQSAEIATPPVVEKNLPDELQVPAEPTIKYPLPASESGLEETPPATEPEPESTAGEPPETEVAPPPAPPPPFAEVVADFFGQAFTEFFIPESLLRHFVVTVDNMTGDKLPQRFSFTRPPPGKFAVIVEPDGSKFLDPANHARYNSYVELLEKTDLQRLVDIYVRYYHLFQEAYENLGYPDRYFNDRLVEVIDHLLATPEVTGKIALQQPKVFYHYNNPKLQALSAGQKVLVRMGPDNAVRVKARLRELRRLLTGG